MSIHDPTALDASSHARQHPPNASADQPVHLHLAHLDQQRRTVDAQLDVYASVLRSNNVDMQSPLVDLEGFPRSDIDVAGVRTARVNIIRLRNDLAALHQEMHLLVLRGLPREEDSTAAIASYSAATANEALSSRPQLSELVPFAKVDAVAPGSPAADAGLLRNDLVVSLGTVSATTTDRTSDLLPAVAALVGRSEGTPLPVTVLRERESLDLTLVPRSGWGGRGLLGCHIVPHTS